MQIRHITPSAQIYIDQLNNYISTGEGYKQIRVLLLKQLNSIDADNHSSDETLAPALMQNLRRKIMDDSSQQKSRTIDVLQDIITYADEIVESYITSQTFCITLQSVITYKLFNPFSKAIFDQNRQRLLSILLHYYSKFQSNPNRYLYVFKTFKQLKQRGYQFPNRSYINIPKVNQFKPKINKTFSEKSSQSEKIGVTFDSIIEFVNDCQHQFNTNRNSCANTQFVRALKVKAKTLFDLSQNTQGFDLSVEQKDHAKQLYKQIRVMLKQIEKISEEKIKQQKIKSQKQFAQQKIQHMTPKKKQNPASGKKELTTSGNLLDEIVQDQRNIGVNNEVRTSSMKKVSSLLDDNNNDDFTQFVTANVQQLSIKKSVSSLSHSKQLSGSDGPKPLKKPPKYDDKLKQQNSVQVEEDSLIETVEPKINTPKKTLSQQQSQPTQLIQTVQIKTIQSKKSLHSQNSDKNVNLIEQPDTVSPSKSNKNVIDFQNQEHFSRFQVVNTLAAKIMDPNAYNVIPHDIDFSDTSSQSGNRVTFETNKNETFFDEQANKPYDRGFLTPKKQLSQHERVSEHVIKSQQNLQKLSSSQKQSQLVADYNFGILADKRQVKAYDYSNVQNVHLERSMSNLSEEEQRKINLTPQSIKKSREPMSMKELSPGGMDFNSQQKKQANQLMSGKDEDEEFDQYQKIQQTFQVKEVKRESLLDKLVSKLQQNDQQILAEDSPEKGQLTGEDDSKISKKEPFL